MFSLPCTLSVSPAAPRILNKDRSTDIETEGWTQGGGGGMNWEIRLDV